MTGFMLNKRIDFNKYIKYLIVAFAFALPISKAGTVLFSVLMVLLWLVEGNFKLKWKELKESKFIILLFSLIIFSCVSVLWAPDTMFAIEFMRKYWHFLVIPVIYTSVNKKNINPIIMGFLIGMLISEIVSYGIFFEIIHYKNILPSNPTPFLDHMNYGTYLAFASLLLLNKFFFEDNIRYKILYFMYFLLTTSSLFLNGSRTGQVIFIGSIFIVGFLNIKNKFKSFIFMTLLIFSIVSISYKVSPNFNNRANQAIQDVSMIIVNSDFSGSFGQRVSLWIAGSNIFKDNILLGTGIGNELNGFHYYANKYNFVHYKNMNLDNTGFIDFHNSFVQYAVQLGIIGLILFVGIFYTLWLNKFTSKQYRNLNIIFIIIFVLHSTVFYSFHLMHPMVLFALFSALLSRISYLEKTETI